jgi:hypothetical protein
MLSPGSRFPTGTAVGWFLARLIVTTDSVVLAPTVPFLFRPRSVLVREIQSIRKTLIGVEVRSVALPMDGFVFWPVPFTRTSVLSALSTLDLRP